jgi:hypothetical protein
MQVPLDTDYENKFWLGGDVEVSFLSRDTLEADLLTFSISVLLDIGLRSLENDLSLRFCSLLN